MKDYDQKCKMCEQGCVHHKLGKFQDGRPYESCKYYGYILHLDKGVTQEICEGYMTEQYYLALQKKKKKKEEAPIPESILQKRRLVDEYLKRRSQES